MGAWCKLVQARNRTEGEGINTREAYQQWRERPDCTVLASDAFAAGAAWAARECERIVAHVPLKSAGKDDDWHFSDTAKAISLEAMTDIRAKFPEAWK